MYLYVNVVLIGTLTSPDQIGYPDDESAIAFDVSQEPSAEIEPTTYTFVPDVVDAYSLKVADTVEVSPPPLLPPPVSSQPTVQVYDAL